MHVPTSLCSLPELVLTTSTEVTSLSPSPNAVALGALPLHHRLRGLPVPASSLDLLSCRRAMGGQRGTVESTGLALVSRKVPEHLDSI